MRRFLCLICLLALALIGCVQTPLGIYPLDGGATCSVWGNEMGIRRLEVTEADGETRRFTLSRPDIEPDADGGFELIDLDFDGHDDVRIKTKQYSNGDLRYTCFLWRDGTLIEHAGLSALRGLASDPATKTLTAWESYTVAEERESRARLTYTWLNGEPVPVEKIELIYYIEEDIYCRITSSAEPGQALAVVDEKWIFPEQFDEGEIWT